MKKLFASVLAMGFITLVSEAQVLNRLKNKVENKTEQKAGQAIDNLLGGKNNTNNQGNPNDPNNPNSTNQGANGNSPGNKSGAGLVTTPPDVKQNLTDAETAYKENGYNEARYALQQAMLGVEMEIGNQILKSLPESISGLKKDDEADQVTSTGWGWAGLTIHREYTDNNDKQLTINVANNAMWMSAVNLYLSGGYAQTGGEQNWKQTKVKGYRAIIEYDDSSGYKLSVPVGQSSLIVFEGINFADEKEMMTAANTVDIDSIKQKLGEQ